MCWPQLPCKPEGKNPWSWSADLETLLKAGELTMLASLFLVYCLEICNNFTKIYWVWWKKKKKRKSVKWECSDCLVPDVSRELLWLNIKILVFQFSSLWIMLELFLVLFCFSHESCRNYWDEFMLSLSQFWWTWIQDWVTFHKCTDHSLLIGKRTVLQYAENFLASKYWVDTR